MLGVLIPTMLVFRLVTSVAVQGLVRMWAKLSICIFVKGRRRRGTGFLRLVPGIVSLCCVSPVETVTWYRSDRRNSPFLIPVRLVTRPLRLRWA